MRFSNILIFLMVLAPVARGDEEIYSPLETSKAEQIINLTESISLSSYDPYYVPCPEINYWNDYCKEPRTYYEINYKGVHQFALARLKSVSNKYYKSWYKEYLNNSFTDEDFKRKLKNLDSINLGRWNRNFWEYEIKNGSKDTVYNVGQDLELLNIKGLTLCSSGKVKVDSVDISLIERDKGNYDLIYNNKLTELEKLNLEIATPETSFLKDNSIKIKGKFSFNIRTDIKDNASNFKAGVSVTVGKVPWLRVQVRGSTQPFQNQHSLQVSFELLRF